MNWLQKMVTNETAKIVTQLINGKAKPAKNPTESQAETEVAEEGDSKGGIAPEAKTNS